MSGKVLKVSSNDLYGNVDDRVVRVYACFEHSKYMNNYVVFSIEGNTKKLCFGSIHLKGTSLVIFSVKDDLKKYILEFVDEYMSGNLNNFKIVDINNIDKVELVSFNEMDYDNLMLLDERSIPRLVTNVEVVVKEKKPIFMYLLIFFLVLFGISITVLYLKPELFTVKYKGLDCTNKLYDNNLQLEYDVKKKFVFDTDDKLESVDVVRTYTFLEYDKYNEFKNGNQHSKYFTNGEGYKYIDGEYKFKVFYQETSVIDDYDEMLTYLKREGFSCVEREYEK